MEILFNRFIFRRCNVYICLSDTIYKKETLVNERFLINLVFYLVTR